MLVGAARADYFPRVTLAARAGYVANSLDALSASGNSRLLAGPVVTLPVLDLGRVRQRVDVARAGRAVAEAEYRATVVRALSESNAALITYDRARARLAIHGRFDGAHPQKIVVRPGVSAPVSGV